MSKDKINSQRNLSSNQRDLPSQYNPKQVEDKIYSFWQKSGYFNPDWTQINPEKLLSVQGASSSTNRSVIYGAGADKKISADQRGNILRESALSQHSSAFSILMPPTNANGSLHAGHALVLTIEDIMIRYKRMRGKKTLWLPGLDHAGFETQVVYEKKLEKEGKSHFKMDPQKLYQEIWDLTENNKKNIIEQTKKMGASCDWSRLKFTLDKDIVAIVNQTFKQLYDDGLVYRGRKIINWCSKHQTSLSDLETTDCQKTDKFYYLKYGPFTIATARPETKFGDKYVVVHPDDKRYKKFKDGQKIKLEWINGPIEATVIKDKVIDREFGTGAMTITPWHDPIDFEISERHNLEKEPIIDFYGRLLPIAGEFSGMKITEARPLIIEKLKSKGLLVKIDENYTHTVKTCYKCGTMIEPQIKDQWFVKMKPLAKPAIKAIKEDKIKFIPKQYKKISLHWLNNILDWNISRQIVWGIRIPAWFCDNCDDVVITDGKNPKKCPHCGSTKLVQDPDVFDTWFSSGQWPFATLMTSGRAKLKVKGEKLKVSDDFNNFYPTSVMETAGEIIFFWVARMIMLGLYKTGKIPFENVYLHGLVLDAHGKKMSKSKGNVIDPLDITDKYGTDALRIGLVIGNTPGTSLALDENKIKGYKFFANKIWNASRFVLTNLTLIDTNKNEYVCHPEVSPKDLEILRSSKAQNDTKSNLKFTKKDKKDLEEFKKLCASITKDMDNFRFYIAAEKIYHYFWHTFCDKIIEDSKKILTEGSDQEKISVQYKLLEILQGSLKLLHPFMPFITEEIWQNMLQVTSYRLHDKSIMISEWPFKDRK